MCEHLVMKKRIGLTLLWSAALACGIALGTGAARAAEQEEPGVEGKKQPPSTGKKAKAGEKCESNDDCDQSGARQVCTENKCRVRMRPPVT